MILLKPCSYKILQVLSCMIIKSTLKHARSRIINRLHACQLSLNIPLFYLAQAQVTSFKQVLAFVYHLLVTNFVKFKQKYGKSSKIVSFIKQINFVRLAGMELSYLGRLPLYNAYFSILHSIYTTVSPSTEVERERNVSFREW